MCFCNPPIDQGGAYFSSFRRICNEVQQQTVDGVLGMLKRVRVLKSLARICTQSTKSYQLYSVEVIMDSRTGELIISHWLEFIDFWESSHPLTEE